MQHIESHDIEKARSFLAAMGRPDLAPLAGDGFLWVYWTMEFYRDDIKGSGGLGMLASDTYETARELGIPAVFVTPFYPSERFQHLECLTPQSDVAKAVPGERGFEWKGAVEVATLVSGVNVPTQLDVWAKEEGSVRLVTVTEPNFGELYAGASESDHRLYQEVSLGFGGRGAMRLLGLAENPEAAHQLNEAPTVFSALARIDEKMDQGLAFDQAYSEVRRKTIYTNHTLVQAAEATFALEQIERFVVPNLRHGEIADWLRKLFHGKGDRLRLSTLALELSGTYTCVSKIHAREAGKVYQDYGGNPVRFAAVTNGVALGRWGDPELLAFLRGEGVLDEFGLPAPGYKEKLLTLNPACIEVIKEIKERGRASLRAALAERRDQRGDSVVIPADAIIFDWKRRFAGYKRPNMVFEELDELKRILEEENAHLVMAGNIHPGDVAMSGDVMRLLAAIDADPVLKERVHFMERYDERLARLLAQGVDASLNTPQIHDEHGNRISTEACGTSWEKSILGNSVLVSTSDGGVADPEMDALGAGLAGEFAAPYLEVRGTSHEGEIDSLYFMMRKACAILKDDAAKWEYLLRQLAEFLPVISSARMEADYINLAFPRPAAGQRLAVSPATFAAAI